MSEVIVGEDEEYTVGQEEAYEPIIEGDLIVEGTFTATRDERQRVAGEEDTIGLIDYWDNDAVVIRENELPYQLLSVLAGQLERLDDDIADIYDQRFVDTATDTHLEKLGNHVGITRQNREGDNSYRVRVNAGYARANSNTAYDRFARVVLNVLDVSEEHVSLESIEDRPVVVIDVPLESVENSALSKEQIIEELNKSIPTGHGVELQSQGTFRLGASGEELPDGSGVGEGTLGIRLN